MRAPRRALSVFASGLALLLGAGEAAAESDFCLRFSPRHMIYMRGPCGARGRVERDADRRRAAPTPAPARPRYQHGRRCNALDPRSGLLIPCFDEKKIRE